MEYQDIVDKNDHVIEVDSRDNIWKRGLEQQTRTVNAFVITKSGKLVIPVRAMTKQNWPGCFDFSCGENVVSKESYDEAIRRGLKEELGISNLSNLKLLGKLKPEDGVFCFMQVYSLTIPDETKLEIDKHEFSDLKLFNINEFRELAKNKENFKRGVVEVWKKYEKEIV